jgi:SAM-dependent methyltransferase
MTPIQDVIRYWNTQPCNIRHSAAPQGSAAYFNDVMARKYHVEPHILLFVDFGAWRDKRVLDVGCGIGTTAVSFALAGAHVTAVDISQHSLDLARQNAAANGVTDRIRFVLADVEHLRDFVRIEPYDLIWSWGVLHHTPHPARALRALRRYTDAGTRLRIMLYHAGSLKAWGLRLKHGDVRAQAEAQANCPIAYTYTPAEATELVTSAGFTIDTLSIDHIFPYQLAAYKRYEYRRTWWAAALPAPVFRALERRFGWHLLIDAGTPPR